MEQLLHALPRAANPAWQAAFAALTQTAVGELPEYLFDETVELGRQSAVGRSVLAQEEQVGAPLLGLLGRRVRLRGDGLLQVVHVPGAGPGDGLGCRLGRRHGHRLWSEDRFGLRRRGRRRPFLELALLLRELRHPVVERPLASSELRSPCLGLLLACGLLPGTR